MTTPMMRMRVMITRATMGMGSRVLAVVLRMMVIMMDI